MIRAPQNSPQAENFKMFCYTYQVKPMNKIETVKYEQTEIQRKSGQLKKQECALIGRFSGSVLLNFVVTELDDT